MCPYDVEKAGNGGPLAVLVQVRDPVLGELVCHDEHECPGQPVPQGAGGLRGHGGDGAVAGGGHQAWVRVSGVPYRLLSQRVHRPGWAGLLPTSAR